MRKPAEVVGESQRRLLLALALARAAEHLEVDLVDHSKPRGADNEGLAEYAREHNLDRVSRLVGTLELNRNTDSW